MMEDAQQDDNHELQNEINGEEGAFEKMIINKKREKFSVQIRNSKKKQILNINRVKMFQKYMKDMGNDGGDKKEQQIQLSIPEHILMDEDKLKDYVKQMIDGLKQQYENYNPSDYSMLLKSINHLRQISLQKQSNFIMIQLIESNIYTILVQLMGSTFDSKLRHEAAWLLNNCLASECQSLQILQGELSNKILDAYISFYKTQNDEESFEIGIWGLTNLFVEDKDVAVEFYRKCGFQNLEQLFIKYKNNINIQELLAWMMTVLSTYNKTFSSFIKLKNLLLKQQDRLLFIKLAEHQVTQNINAAIQHYGIRIIYKLTLEEDCCLEIAKNGKIIDDILSLTHQSEYINYVIGIMGNMCSCENIVKILLEHNILEYLSVALDNVRVDIRKEAMWCISNISLEKDELQQIIDHNRLLEKIFIIAKIDSFDVVYEVCHFLSNFLGNAKFYQVMRLLQLGILEVFVSILMIQDLEITSRTLQNIGFLLDYGQEIKQSNQINPVKDKLQQLGFNQILESLQMHSHQKICDQANELYSDYYETQSQQGSMGQTNDNEE